MILSLSLLLLSSQAWADLSVKYHNKYGKIYEIHSQIGPDIAEYQPLIDALVKAKKGQVIYVVVMQNRGGYMRTLAKLTHYISQTKGAVIMEARGFIASAAALLVFQGDLVRINHDSQILFHNIRYFDKGRVVIPSRLDRNTPSKIYIYHSSLSWFARTRVAAMLTGDEWEKLLDGKDVIVRGERICNWGVKTRVIANRFKSCLTRGVK